MKKATRVFLHILMLFFIAILIFCILGLLRQNNEEVKIVSTYTQIAEAYTSDASTDILDESISADFFALQAVNSDIKGWIQVPNTSIDYPILQGTDNDFYLQHGHDKQYLKSGSAFFDYRIDVMQSKVVMVYGHNMSATVRDIMFSELIQYREQDYYKENRTLNLALNDGSEHGKEYSCRIFAVCAVNSGNQQDVAEHYQLTFNSDAEYEDYLSNLQETSLYECSEIATPDRILVLSTCSRVSGTDRLTIYAGIYG